MSIFKEIIEVGVISWFLTMPERVGRWAHKSGTELWGKAMLISLSAWLAWSLVESDLARAILEFFGWTFFVIGALGFLGDWQWPEVFSLGAILQGALISFVIFGRWLDDYETAWLLWPPLAALCEITPRIARFWVDPPPEVEKPGVRSKATILEGSIQRLIASLLVTCWLAFGITVRDWTAVYPYQADDFSDSAFVRAIELFPERDSVVRRRWDQVRGWFGWQGIQPGDRLVLESLRQTVEAQRLQDPNQREAWLQRLGDPQTHLAEQILLDAVVLPQSGAANQQVNLDVELLGRASSLQEPTRLRLVVRRQDRFSSGETVIAGQDCQIQANSQPVTLVCSDPMLLEEVISPEQPRAN
ncbi:DUF5357 family protein [Leptolyngbya sp. FACHB-261]|uniref:DUF5357 family protein n=1 Tax=Leptolyngbya sp. FACHB-261 TaxID=2692806 RepID=UPI001686A350|nr:DUF5357 family protein [Leptolyngbya sp. FACHB-261]MBD2104340.1 DUF5357 family protein [Leptolyngbya sp. FACHB-261]